MATYILHFVFGGAVAPPDMGVAYVFRILPILVVAYCIIKYEEFDGLLNQATGLQ